MQGHEYIGIATMREDGTIVLDLWAEGSGGILGEARVEYPPGHERYQEVLDHIGPMKPGETRPIPPWSEPTAVVEVGARDYACPGVEGFTFQFLEFPNWSAKGIAKTREDECVIWLNWPDNVVFEQAPRVTVTKLPELGINSWTASAIERSNGELGLETVSEVQVNPSGVPYCYIHDPSRWARDFRPRPGQWDYLQFYGPAFAVRIDIYAGGESYGFNKQRFAEKVIETFVLAAVERA